MAAVVKRCKDPITKEGMQMNRVTPEYLEKLEDTTEEAPQSDAALLAAAYKGVRGEDQQAIAQAAVEMAVLLLRKNSDYGGSVFERPMLLPDLSPGMAIRVRMSDKMKRIIQLSAHDQEVVGESIEDSLDDLCGYRILERALRIRTLRRG